MRNRSVSIAKEIKDCDLSCQERARKALARSPAQDDAGDVQRVEKSRRKS